MRIVLLSLLLLCYLSLRFELGHDLFTAPWITDPPGSRNALG
jgi:hypothetical protein